MTVKHICVCFYEIFERMAGFKFAVRPARDQSVRAGMDLGSCARDRLGLRV